MTCRGVWNILCARVMHLLMYLLHHCTDRNNATNPPPPPPPPDRLFELEISHPRITSAPKRETYSIHIQIYFAERAVCKRAVRLILAFFDTGLSSSKSRSGGGGRGGGGGTRYNVLPWSYDGISSHPYNPGTDHVGLETEPGRHRLHQALRNESRGVSSASRMKCGLHPVMNRL